jgi:hypothetical protein
MNKFIYPLVILFITLFLSCSKKKEQKVSSVDKSYNSNNSYNNNNYHENNNYKYEYRTGSNGNYNYDVVGTDNNGNNVSGNIDISGKYGSGTIEDENGNNKDIDVEWSGNGILDGTDNDGNTYDLESE